MIRPFCSARSGGLHVTVMVETVTAVVVTEMGGPSGAVVVVLH